MDGPYSSCPAKAEAPPLQEGQSLGAAPCHLQLGSPAMQNISVTGFPITDLGQWEELWCNITSLSGLGKGRLWGELLTVCSCLGGVIGKGNQALWGGIQ